MRTHKGRPYFACGGELIPSIAPTVTTATVTAATMTLVIVGVVVGIRRSIVRGAITAASCGLGNGGNGPVGLERGRGIGKFVCWVMDV
jgi:hypothetical protein